MVAISKGQKKHGELLMSYKSNVGLGKEGVEQVHRIARRAAGNVKYFNLGKLAQRRLEELDKALIAGQALVKAGIFPDGVDHTTFSYKHEIGLVSTALSRYV